MKNNRNNTPERRDPAFFIPYEIAISRMNKKTIRTKKHPGEKGETPG